MITRLSGILESLDGNAATIIPAAGPPSIAYEVLLPAYLASRLADSAATGKPITLHTLHYLEGQGQGTSFVPRLLGFASPRERDFFELFTTVKGLGNKRALRALAQEPGAIAALIAAKDSRALKELPEIGPRLAETIVAELIGKVETYADFARAPSGPGSAPLPPTPVADEAVHALISLGESRPDAERKVARVLQRNPALADTGEILQAALAGR